MRRIRLIGSIGGRCALLCWLLWAASAAWLPAASPGSEGPVVSGTYRGRVLTELFRHRQEQLRRGGRAALASDLAKPLRADIGNIAIIEDTNGVVIQANRFDLEGRALTFAPSSGLYTVTAGPVALDQTARNLGMAVVLDDDDAKAVLLPFAFPFFGSQYTQAFLHSDGNLTFEESDMATSARSLARAVTGPPRIAPFFSDLDPKRLFDGGAGRFHVG
jgi:hypothetical protein